MAPPVQPPAGPSPRAPASPAAAPSTTATPVSGSITRADIVTLGRTGDPWAFVPLAIHALTIATDDHEVRFLLAAAYAKLGLRTAAAETLDHLAAAFGTAAQSHPALAQLAQVLAQLPDDRVPLTTRLRTLERNLDALASRPVAPLDLRHHLGDWSARAATMQCFSARGGNILFRDANRRWLRFADDVALAAQYARKDSDTLIAPIIFEGIVPPWLWLQSAKHTPARPDGQCTRLSIVDVTVSSFLDGLSLAECADLLREERVTLFIGENAGQNFATWLREHATLNLGNVVFTAPILVRQAQHAGRVGAGSILAAARDEQLQEFARLKEQTEAAYAHRTREWWFKRYSEAETGGEPLRVLIPTSRYTSFVQHSCADLAAALRECGCHVRVMIEPDSASNFSALEYWRNYANWQPDLVLCVNFTRSLSPCGAPVNVPFVTWIQDQAGMLLDRKVGAGLGELDFVVGYLFPKLFDDFGFPRTRNRFMSVLVSGKKFHPAPVDGTVRDHFTCEIAYVSQHSEPVEKLIESLLAQASDQFRGSLTQILSELRPRLSSMIAEGLEPRCRQRISSVSRELLAKTLHRAPDNHTVSQFAASYAYPIAERLLRHQMLAWAAELCEERGWKLNIYGNGWDKNPQFAAFARGSLKHGEDLRAAYQCARVHLHAGMGAPIHQRIMECALSGGATLVRLKGDDLDVVHQWWAMGAECANPGQMSQSPPRWSSERNAWIDSPPALPTVVSRGIHARLGVVPIEDHPQDAEFTFPTREIPWPVYHGTPVAMQEALLSGDPQDSMFWSRDTFRALATLAVTNATFRDGLAAWQRTATHAQFTFEVCAREFITTVKNGLSDSNP